MKIRLLMILIFLFSLLGALTFFRKEQNLKSDWMKDSGKVKVLSTTAIVGDLVERIGGNEVDHLILMKGETDPHSYELVKGDAEIIDRADLIFSNGLGLEHGASLVYALKKHRNHVPLANIFKSMNGQALYFEGQLDPHVWMDVSMWMQLAPEVEEKLVQLCPERAEVFHKNAAELKKEWEALHQEIFSQIQSVPEEMRYLVTSHDAFQYFARRYLAPPGATSDWQERISAPEGLAPDGQLSIKNIEEVLQFLQLHKIHVIFPESSVSRDSIKKIVEVASQKNMNVTIVKEPLYSDTLGPKNSGASDYPSMMRSNAKVISNHLNMQNESAYATQNG